MIDRFQSNRDSIEALRKVDQDFCDLHDDYHRVIDMLSEAEGQSERNRLELIDLRDALATEIDGYLEKFAAPLRDRQSDGS